MSDKFNQELWVKYQNDTLIEIADMDLETLAAYIKEAEAKVFQFKTKEARARAAYREKASKLPTDEKNKALGSLDGSLNLGNYKTKEQVAKAHKGKIEAKKKELSKLAKSIAGFKLLGNDDETIRSMFSSKYTNEQINNALDECRKDDE